MPTCFKVTNWLGQTVSNITVTATWGGTRRQAITDANGIARFADDIPESAAVISTGMTTPTRITCTPEIPPIPPSAGEYVVSTVGTQCDILSKEMFGTSWYKHKNRYTGSGSSWDSEYNDAVYRAQKDSSCYEPPPPPPRTVDDVQKDVDIMRGTLSGALSRIDDVIASFGELRTIFTAFSGQIIAEVSGIKVSVAGILKFMDTIDDWFIAQFTKMKDIVIEWVTDAFVSIIEKALDREVR